MLLITGGAGFIGSNLVASLNESGRTDIVINDRLGSDDKWRNLAKRQFADLVQPDRLFDWLGNRRLDAVIHLGAISDTTATDADLVVESNFRLSLRILDWCGVTGTPLIYASSAATYGVGPFDDNVSSAELRQLKPMNLYGWSKHLFDCAVAERASKGLIGRGTLPPQWVGLKFFNVFGPNEYHKGEMRSLIAKRFDDARAGKPVRLFKSHRVGVIDGEQMRDFVHVDDAVAVLRWFIDTPSVSGIFNVGTGAARSFSDLVLAMFHALGVPPNIEYVDMPSTIRDQYQYYTQAKIENLRRAGYSGRFTSLEDSVTRYVTGCLACADRYR